MVEEKGDTPGGGRSSERTVVYCLIPRDLAPKLHDYLRAHFRDDSGIEVVVERRGGERRGGDERRGVAASTGAEKERRQIRGRTGRRIAERRAVLVPSSNLPDLPRRARRHSGRLRFVERLEPAEMEAEDLETARLITRVQAGDSESFAAIYVRYFDRVYGYMRTLLRDSHEAEDAAQQVFVKVMEALPRYEHRSEPFRAWLFVIARRHALTVLQKQERLELAEPAEISQRAGAGVDSAGEESYLRSLDWISDRDLVLFVERLPLVQRQVLLLRYVLDLPHAEIARILDQSPQNVRTIQRRAMAFLRQRLAAVGRVPAGRGRRTGMLGRTRQAYVLRQRRFVLRA